MTKLRREERIRMQRNRWMWSKSLHRFIRDTPLDTEVHAEHQLRVDRST